MKIERWFLKTCAVLFYGLFFSNLTFSQPLNSIKGKVKSAGNGTPISGCSVFISNTSRGTVTDANGEFELKGIPEGSYQLVVSNIGFESYVYPFSGKQLPLDLRISLKVKVTELSAVVIEPYLKDGWQKWGKFFLDNFIGTGENALHCKIKNEKLIRFRYSKRQNKLTAIAGEPLVIENKALGYTIKYELEEFSFDQNSNTVGYFGYPLFLDMDTKSAKRRERWQHNRRLAYLGSMMHFVRCLYQKQLPEEDFEVRQMFRRPNIEKERVKRIYNTDPTRPDTFRVDKNGILQINKERKWPADSIRYYMQILDGPDSTNNYTPLIPADSLVNIGLDQTRTFFFTGKLYVTYKNLKEGRISRSVMNLLTPAPVQLEANGDYYPPQEVFISGSWATSEKMANCLPFDYINSERK